MSVRGRGTFRRASDSQINQKVVDHVATHANDLSFTKAFWKRCEPNRLELKHYSEYALVMRHFRKGSRLGKVSGKVSVSESTVRQWQSFRKRPKFAHYLKAYLLLGKPKQRRVWLSTNNTPGHAIPLGPFVQVPSKIARWDDVEGVLRQLRPRPPIKYELRSGYKFGFLLGVMIGDASKKRQKNWHRHLELVLSKRYSTDRRIGDFTADCARTIGLKMRRMRDIQPNRKPHGFYVWESQSSAFLDWIFNV